eukprot:3437487-Prorocentrum_lima.AAC.1
MRSWRFCGADPSRVPRPCSACSRLSACVAGRARPSRSPRQPSAWHRTCFPPTQSTLPLAEVPGPASALA